MNKKISFLGIKVDCLSKKEMVDVLLGFSETGFRRTSFYLNAHCVNIVFSDNEYHTLLNRADLVYPEGQSIVWAARFLGTPLPERVNILDFIGALINELRERKITIYLLGGVDNVVKKVERVFKQKGLEIVGCRSGFFDEREEMEIVQEINKKSPDILMVGMGVPKQEKWILRHLNELNVNLCWGVGAAFDWFSGDRKRAPRWMINFGLEWLHRLFQEPKKLWRRYLFGNPVFIYRVLKYKITSRYF